jgi:spermidine synthase
MKNKFNYLLFTALVSGISTMGTQIAVSRLLAPYFGTSLPVWTGVLSCIMIALSVGYYVGGRIADKFPHKHLFYKIILVTGIYIGLIPFMFIPLTRLATSGIEKVATTYHIGGLVLFALSLMVLFLIVPFVTLGMFISYAIKLNIEEQQHKQVSSAASSILSCSVVGSIMGTFLSTFFIIPTIGTSKSLFIFSTFLMLISIIALKKWFLLLLPLGAMSSINLSFQIKPEKSLIYETESMYNYIQVFNIHGINILRLNEGHAEHSLYQKDQYLFKGYWKYYTILGCLNKGGNALILGLAGGTTARQYTHFIHDSQVDGIEIDPAIVKVAQRYFNLGGIPSLQIFTTDGRLYLATTSKRYDHIMIDAWKQPYIPFHLTTQEFFQEVKNHLNERGMVSINIGSTEPNSPVLLKIENTIKSVFKHVYRVYVKRSLNYFVWATDYEFDLHAVELNKDQAALHSLLTYMQQQTQEIQYNPYEIVLTDNRAPLELSTDKMILEILHWDF